MDSTSLSTRHGGHAGARPCVPLLLAWCALTAGAFAADASGGGPVVSASSATTADLVLVAGQPIPLPPPHTEGGMPLMTALARRHSTREFRSDPLPLSVLSDLLWAAAGISRAESGKRTAPAARNWQNLDIYVATARGMFHYDASTHALPPVRGEDLRAVAGKQPFAASAGLGTVVRAYVDRPALGSAMGLAPTQRITLAQSIGYPQESK